MPDQFVATKQVQRFVTEFVATQAQVQEAERQGGHMAKQALALAKKEAQRVAALLHEAVTEGNQHVRKILGTGSPPKVKALIDALDRFTNGLIAKESGQTGALTQYNIFSHAWRTRSF